MSGKAVFLSILAEDKWAISYRPRFAALTDSAMAAILLQQMIHWWKANDCQPFYKFRDTCKHELYHAGDSWCEELIWNHGEFDNALKVIGTKITKGIKKQDILAIEMPTRKEDESDEQFRDRLKASIRGIILYWTDSNRITWYQVNENLLDKFINQIYLDKFYGLRYLEKLVSGFTQKKRWAKRTSKESETNPQTTPEIKDYALTSADVEPDGTSEWMIENQRNLKPNEDWLKRPAHASANGKPPTPVPATPSPAKGKSKNKHPELIYPVKEALVKAFAYQSADMTKDLENGLFKVASKLVDIDDPVLPDDVQSLVDYSRQDNKGKEVSIWWLAGKVADWRKWLRGKVAGAPPTNGKRETPLSPNNPANAWKKQKAS